MQKTTSKKFTSLLSIFFIVANLSFSSTPVLEKGKHNIVKPVLSNGLCVHNFFQSGMVLQRDKPIRIWGWAKIGEEVSVSLSGLTLKTTADNKRFWQVSFPTSKANSNPQTLIVKGKKESLTFDNILIGDIWVAGGQSNMQHPLRSVEGGSTEIASANFKNIRLLTVPAMIDNTEKNNFPILHRHESGRHYREGFWTVCSPNSVYDFSAIAYVFARRIHMASQVPIGIIDASRWGTTVEAWTPIATLRKINEPSVKTWLADWDKKATEYSPETALKNRIKWYNDRTKRLKSQGRDVSKRTPTTIAPPNPLVNQNHPGNCYASIIKPLAGIQIKGAIYHQGFNNSRYDAAEFYYAVFPKLIEEWRKTFNNPEMAFGIISLCTDSMPQTLDNYVESMMNTGVHVREAHYKTFLKFYNAGDKNVGFASSFDLRRAWFHPQHKIPAGERIARWALSTQYGYGNKIPWKPPIVTKMEVIKGAIHIHFDKSVGSPGREAIVGFAIAGKDKKFQPAKANALMIGKDSRGRLKYDYKVLILSSPHVIEPIHYRYAWARNPLGNLASGSMRERDILFATQRSDNWGFAEVPYINPLEDKGASRESVKLIRSVLKRIDAERKLRDAETYFKENKEAYIKMVEAFEDKDINNYMIIK
jgi:sialate O-acetylesterase